MTDPAARANDCLLGSSRVPHWLAISRICAGGDGDDDDDGDGDGDGDGDCLYGEGDLALEGLLDEQFRTTLRFSSSISFLRVFSTSRMSITTTGRQEMTYWTKQKGWDGMGMGDGDGDGRWGWAMGDGDGDGRLVRGMR